MDAPRTMNAIAESQDDPRVQGTQSALDQVPGASDFTMLSQTMSKHMAAPSAPQPSENEAFVQELEAAINHELKVLKCPASGPSMARLQVYRQAFDILMKHFRAYRPMLSMIRQEYDAHLDVLQDQCDALKKLESDIGLCKFKREEEIVKTLHDFKTMQERLSDTLAGKTSEIEGMKEKLRELRKEVAKFRGISDTVAKALEEGQNSNKHLRTRVEHLVDTIGEAKREEDPEMRKAYNKSKREYDKLYKDMSELRSQLLHVLIPPKDLEEAKRRLDKLSAQEKALRDEKKAVADQLHEAACEERRLDKRKADLEEQLRLSTPRPDWSRPEKILNLQGIVIDPKATTTKLKVDDLVQKITSMRAKKTEYQERLKKWEAEQAKSNKKVEKSQAAQNKKYITARGDTPNVPKFLRFNGKVRRRDIPKRDVELLVNDCWKQKAEYDAALAEKGEGRSTLEDFMYIYLQKRFGLQAMIAEWGYNLLEALYKYRHDADEEIFLYVLRNKMHEDFYHQQMKLCEDFEDQLAKLYTNGTIPAKKNLIEFLRTFFPSKSEERFDELIESLDEQCPGDGAIQWASLLEEDRQGDQGPFAEAMRDQDLQERQEYFEDIEEALLVFAMSKDDPPPTELPAEEIRSALIGMDAGMKIALGEKQLDRIMAVGFNKAPSDIMYDTCPTPAVVDGKEVVSIEKFVKRVLKMTIKRYEVSISAGDERQAELKWSKKSLDDEDEPAEGGDSEPLRKFTHEEVNQLADHFHELSKDTNGVITRPQFLEAIEFVTHAGRHFAERLFAIFDESQDEQISFPEFKMAMHVLCRGSPDERLTYVFQAYDNNQDGTITRDEMFLFLLMANKMTAKEDRKDRDQLKALVDDCFAAMDLNLDGALSLDECKKCMANNTWIGEIFDKL